MKSLIFKLSDTAQVNRLMAYLKENWRQAIKNGKPLIITVTEKDEDYTSKQRRLYFMWIGQYAKHFGEEKDDAHLFIKRKFLIGIYRRDDAGYASMCDAIAMLKDSEPEQHRAIGEHVIKLTSITKASKAQMTELLDDFFRFAVSKGLVMKCPDDLKFIREMKGGSDEHSRTH